MRILHRLATVAIFMMAIAALTWLATLENRIRPRPPAAAAPVVGLCEATAVEMNATGAFEHTFQLTVVPVSGSSHVDLYLEDLSEPSINLNDEDPAHVTLSGIIPLHCRPRETVWVFGTGEAVNGTTYIIELYLQLNSTSGDIAIYLTDGTTASEWMFPSLNPIGFTVNAFSYATD